MIVFREGYSELVGITIGLGAGNLHTDFNARIDVVKEILTQTGYGHIFGDSLTETSSGGPEPNAVLGLPFL